VVGVDFRRTLYVELDPVPVGIKLLGVKPDGKVHEEVEGGGLGEAVPSREWLGVLLFAA